MLEKQIVWSQLFAISAFPAGVSPNHALTPEKIFPWHRVVGAGGKISLTGEGCKTQRKILESEGVRFSEKGTIGLREFGWSKQLS